MRAWYLVILGLSALALIFGPIRTGRPVANRIPNTAAAGHFEGDFIPNGTFGGVSDLNLPKNVETRGSWVGADAFVGNCTTSWYSPLRRVTLMVSGYPRAPGNTLAVEVRDANGELRLLPYKLENPGETWDEWSIILPEGVRAFRIVAADGATSGGGWLAFSEPFKNLEYPWWKNLCRFTQLLTTSCLAFALLYGPGLCWVLYKPERRGRWAEAILPGPICLAGVGLAMWILGGIVPPPLLARVFLILLLCGLAFAAVKIEAGRWSAFTLSKFFPVLLLSILVSLLAITKSSLSMGPEGELYHGTVSRTLDPSGHSDSRIAYCLVQVVAHHLSPTQQETIGYYAPWRLTSRGPLAGLLAAPLVVGCGAEVPLDFPDQKWSPFDREGFAIYRITMIVLASLAAWAVFGTVGMVGTETGAVFCTLILLATPFFIHQMFFTWPKLIAAAHVLLAFVAVERRSFFTSGVVLALGYLYHPLVSLSVPFLAFWAICRIRPWSFISALRGGIALGAGVMSLVLPWLLFDHFVVNLDHSESGQRVFLTYFFVADNRPASLMSWLLSRWHNLSYTFFPFWFFTADFSHESLNSFYQPSNRWIHYSFIYWHTFPFGLGLPAYIATLYPTFSTMVRHFAAAFILLIAPVIFLIFYWGAADTGFMSYTGHVIFLTAISFIGFSFSRPLKPSALAFFRLLCHPLFITARLLDFVFVCLGTTLLSHFPNPDDTFFINDITLLALFFFCLGWAFYIIVKEARAQLRPDQPTIVAGAG